MPEWTAAKKACETFRADPLVLALKDKGLDFDVYARGSAVTLENIGVEEGARGQGVGSQALKRLLEIADDHRVTVDLEVGTDEAGIGLVDWYTRHGFVWKEGFMAREHQAGPLSADENFKAWFSASKVIDRKGQPLVVYHGTASDVQQFDPSLSGSKSKTGAPEGVFFFTDKPDVASSYTVKWQGDFSAQHHDSANVMPLYLSIQKPFKVSARGASWREISHKGDFLDINELAQWAKDSGRYDGVIVTRVRDKGMGHAENELATTYIAFSPTQMKSAIGNSGAFSPTDPDTTDRAALTTRAHQAMAWLQEPINLSRREARGASLLDSLVAPKKGPHA